MLYLITTTLLISGFLFVRCLRIKHNVLLNSYAFGIGLAGFSIAVTGRFSLNWSMTFVVYAAICVAVLVGLVFQSKKLSISLTTITSGIRSLSTNWVLFTFITVYVFYYVGVGVYDLVPSDALRHLERLQFAYRDITDGINNNIDYRSGFDDYYIYYLYSMTWRVSGLDVHAFFYHISLISNLIFLTGLYLFARAIFQVYKEQADFIALLSCVLFVLHQGFAGFPYLRYYALSATLWMMPVFSWRYFTCATGSKAGQIKIS